MRFLNYLHPLFIAEQLCRRAKPLMHIVKQGGVKELTRQTGSFQEPAVCLIDGLRAINGMQVGQVCVPTHTSQLLLCFYFCVL